jgi:hypothetical protein
VIDFRIKSWRIPTHAGPDLKDPNGIPQIHLLVVVEVASIDHNTKIQRLASFWFSLGHLL